MSLIPKISFIIISFFFITGCSSLPDEIKHSADPQSPFLSSQLSELVDAHRIKQSSQNTSAVFLQESGWDALAQRLALIETAEHSIDIQYYIWNSDLSGHYLVSRLLAAADRGVKIRVMLDDINLNEREDLLTAINAHPKIEIRIFNPIPSRGATKLLRVVGDFTRLNHRMHNKSFTVDGVLSVVGGRNIGDEYFDLSDEINFRDRDVLVMGSVVSDIQDSFVNYWDSGWSYPIDLLGGETPSTPLILPTAVTPVYKNYPALPEGNKVAHHFLIDVMNKMHWVKASFIADNPVPIDVNDTSQPKATAKLLAKLAHQAKNEIILESAYLIFDDRQLKEVPSLTSKGVVIKALTNSMASNDLVANHSGYAGRRKEMLRRGIHLFELKPDASVCEISTKDASKCAPETSYGLHAKSIVFDREIVGIGSFNFNLRSTYLNTESVLIIEDKYIAESLATNMEQAMSEQNSWRLKLVDGDVRWYSGTESWEVEPDTGLLQRTQSRILQWLPIEKYL